MNEDDRAVFELYLPLTDRVVRSVSQIDVEEEEEEVDEDLAALEKRPRANLKLYKCCDVKGKYRVSEIKLGPLCQDDLLSSVSIFFKYI